MPPERFRPEDPMEWLNRARSNLVRAKEVFHISGVYLEDLCFDAQQAAEKALKACCCTVVYDSLMSTIWQNLSAFWNRQGRMFQMQCDRQ